MSEYDFYQIDHVGVADTEHVITIASGVQEVQTYPIRRRLDEKVSYFGSNNVGARMESDLTRTDLGFQSKDELADRETITEDTGMGSNVAARAITTDHNPYLIGSTIKKTRDDQAFKIGLGLATVSGVSIDVPGFDVMDDNLIDLTGMTIASGIGVVDLVGKNWPTEGFRSFGGKYDFEPYMGGGTH